MYNISLLIGDVANKRSYTNGYLSNWTSMHISLLMFVVLNASKAMFYEGMKVIPKTN